MGFLKNIIKQRSYKYWFSYFKLDNIRTLSDDILQETHIENLNIFHSLNLVITWKFNPNAKVLCGYDFTTFAVR